MKDTHETAVIHAQKGENHFVGLSALRVLLIKEDDSWFAQGLEIDYAAAGSTIEEVKVNFEDGLCHTIHEHLRMLGNLDKLLQLAPQEAWDEFFSGPKECVRHDFSMLSFYKVEEDNMRLPGGAKFPFDRIAFITTEPELAAA